MIKAEYANIVNVKRLAEEFILDFVLKCGEKNEEADTVARVILSPAHVVRLGDMLTKLSALPEAEKKPLSLWPPPAPTG